MPVGVVEPTTIVIVELPFPGAGMEVGLKVAVAPEGSPEAESAIELLKPPLTAVVMVDVPWLPCAMLSDAGDAVIVNVGAVTVRVTVVFCCTPPPLPVMVIG